MRYLLLFTFIFFSNIALAQSINVIDTSGTVKSNGPIFIVNGILFENSKVFEQMITLSDIEKIEILKDSISTTLFCRRTDHDVILVTLKKNVKLLSFEELLKKHKIKRAYRQYVTYIDDQPVSNINNFYASPSKIKEIRLQYRKNGISEIPYLNIVTNP